MSAAMLHLDVETRSTTDLRKTNAYIYFDDPNTDIWCAAYAFGDEEPKLWVPGEPCPGAIAKHVEAGGLVVAWNAMFERLAWRQILGPRYGWPVPKLEQYRCAMVQAYAMGLPGRLDHAAGALGIEQRKDDDGHRVMLQLCQPRRPRKGETHTKPVWWDDPDKIARLGRYCQQDVRTEIAVFNRLPSLRESEQQLYFLDARMNDRGVYIDVPLCNAASKIVERTTAKLNDELMRVTDCDVRGVSNTAEFIRFVKRRGLDASSIAKDKVIELLIRDDLTPDVRRALEIRQEGAKTSTAKIGAMLVRRQHDGRMRGNLQFHGTGTGRWAARGAQLQNLPRPVLQGGLSLVITDLRKGDAGYIEIMYGPPLTVVSDCIRGMVAAPPGRKILAADLRAIEARVTSWLSGQAHKLDAFRAYDAGSGPDLYVVAAAGIYRVPMGVISKEDPRRQVGKVSELALGFQGGASALLAMAKLYSVDIAAAHEPVWESTTPENREDALKAWQERGKRSGAAERAWVTSEAIKLAWRDDNPDTVTYWTLVERAAITAVENPGEIIEAGALRYRKAGSWLLCRLPSGRCIAYAYPKIVDRQLPWGGTKPALNYWAVDSFTKQWSEQFFYGGLGLHNAVQATARDVMGEGMVRVENAGYEPILTVHDEVVSEVDIGFGSPAEYRQLIVEPPAWSGGLPIAAEAWEGDRYRK